MEVNFEIIGTIIGVALGIAAIIDRVWGPQSLRIKVLEERMTQAATLQSVSAIEDRLHQQDLINQKFDHHHESLSSVLSRLTVAIEKLETKFENAR
jgi:hypothetical protein